MTLLIPYSHYYRVAGPPKEYRFWGVGLTGGFWQSQLSNRMGTNGTTNSQNMKLKPGDIIGGIQVPAGFPLRIDYMIVILKGSYVVCFLGLLCFWGRGL